MNKPAKTDVPADFFPIPVHPLTSVMVNSDQRLVFAIPASNGLELEFVNGSFKRLDAAFKLPNPFFKHLINETFGCGHRFQHCLKPFRIRVFTLN